MADYGRFTQSLGHTPTVGDQVLTQDTHNPGVVTAYDTNQFGFIQVRFLGWKYSISCMPSNLRFVKKVVAENER